MQIDRGRTKVGSLVLWFFFVSGIVSVAVGLLMAPMNIMEIGFASFLKRFLGVLWYHKQKTFFYSCYILVAVYVTYQLKKKGKLTSKAILALWVYALIGTIFFVYKDFILGKSFFIYRDIGGDTFDQYCPVYYGMVRRIRGGTFSTWNWDYGLGTSAVCNLSQLLEPFGFLIVLVGVIFGAQTIKYMLVITQILKIVICFFLCRKYLKLFDLSENACCLASYLYALSGYLILWGQHYLLGIGCIIILLVLYAVERFLRDRTFGAGTRLAIVVALSVIWSYYMGYMALAFAAIYFIVSLFRPGLIDTMRNRWKLFWRCAFYVLDGLLISCITLIPAYSFLTSVSSRLDNSQGVFERFIAPFFTFVGKESFYEIIARLLSNNLLFKMLPYEGAQNYYEMPIMVFSCFMIFVLVQYAIKLIRNRTDKKYFAYQCVIIVIALVLLFSRGMWYAFNTFTVVTFRGSFVYFPIMALLFAKTWKYAIEETHISVVGVFLGAALSVGLLLKLRNRASGEVTNYYLFFMIAFAIVVLLYLIAKIWNDKKHYCIMALCVLFGVTTMFEAYISTNRVTQQEDPLHYADGNVTNDMTKAIEIIKETDKSILRIQRDYNDWGPLGDSMVDGYSCIITYNSTLDRNITDLYENAFNQLHTAGAIYGMHAGIMDDPLNYATMSVAGVKYYITQQDVPYEWCELIGNVGTTKIYKNKNARSLMNAYTKYTFKQDFENASQEEKIRMIQETVIVDNDMKLPKVSDNVETKISELVKVKDNYLKGEVAASESAYLMLSIPAENGWDIFLDGKKMDIYNADYGFIGIMLPEGTHTIEAKYHIPHMNVGMIVCGCGIFILIIDNIYNRKRKKFQNRMEK